MKRNGQDSINKALKKRNRRRGLWGFLVLLLLVLTLIGLVWSFSFQPLLGIVTQQRFFKAETFDRIDAVGINDGNGYIEFLDDNYNVVYPKNSQNTYTQADVDNMGNVFFTLQRVRQYAFIKDGVSYTQIISGSSTAENSWYLIVDSDLNYVDSTNFNYIKPQYTQQDIDYILSDYIFNLEAYTYTFTSNYGNDFTMVMVVGDEIEVLEPFELWLIASAILLFILLYIFVLVFSSASTGRFLKRPLQDLSDAINAFTTGEHVLIKKDYKAAEFNAMADAFNHMVLSLKQLEQKNLELSNQKQRMIADISHDLKTPITIIQGYIDAIKTGKVKGEKMDAYLSKVYAKTEHMTALINSFAEYSKLNHPGFKLNLARHNICDVVRDYMAETYNYITDNGDKLSVDIPDAAYTCQIDQVHFTRSLANIVSNFIKHNPKGTTLHVALKKTAQTVVLTLANDGTPIAQNIEENLFEPLVTGDNARSSQSSGLGLASAKKVIELHGGTLTYARTKQYANVFTITLPLA